MIWKKSLTVFVLMLLMFAAGDTVAQGSDDAGRIENIRRYLEQNDALIQTAREAVQTADNPVAEQNLLAALQLNEQAWEAFRLGTLLSYAQALKLGQQARERAKAAVSSARQSKQYEGLVLRRLERAAELLERAREMSPLNDRAGFGALYEGAREELDRAWEFYRAGRYRPAVKLADQVERAARKIMAQRGGDRQEERQFQHRLDNARELLEQARLSVIDCDAESAAGHLDRAEKAQEMALQLAEQGRSDAALQALKRSRDEAIQAMRQCQGADRLQNRYEQLRQQTEALRERLSNYNQTRYQEVSDLLEQAERQLELANRHLKEDQWEPAVASLQAAQLAVRQAQRYMDNR